MEGLFWSFHNQEEIKLVKKAFAKKLELQIKGNSWAKLRAELEKHSC